MGIINVIRNFVIGIINFVVGIIKFILWVCIIRFIIFIAIAGIAYIDHTENNKASYNTEYNYSIKNTK